MYGDARLTPDDIAISLSRVATVTRYSLLLGGEKHIYQVTCSDMLSLSSLCYTRREARRNLMQQIIRPDG